MAERSRWAVPLDKLAEKAKASLHTVARKATADVFRAVVLRSPVDTGRFRANWNVNYGAPLYATTDSTDKSRGVAEANKGLTLPVGGVVYLSNGLPYARRLEYGYSKQAPGGMVRVSAQEFSDYVQKAIAK